MGGNEITWSMERRTGGDGEMELLSREEAERAGEWWRVAMGGGVGCECMN